MIQARIALLTNFIPPYRLPLFKALSERVSDLQIYISTPMEPNRSWSPNWESLKVQVQRTLTLKRIWRHPSGFNEPIYFHLPFDTLPKLQKFRPDVIISAELGIRSFQAALYHSFHPRSRLILWATLSEHTEQGRGWLRLWLRHWLLPRANAILVNGKSGTRYIKRFGIPDLKIILIGQTPQTEKFAGMPLERLTTNSIRLLAVGRLIERKGLLPFLQVLSQWAEAHPNQKVEFVCAGDGPLDEALLKQKLPSNLKLLLLGNINYPDIPAIYAGADILAFPTLADEWGLVVNEALAAGLPVLGSLYSQAVEEMVEDVKTGWTFRPDHEDEMSRAIDCALSVKPECLAEMRVAARARAFMITPDTMAEKIVRAIELVLA
jgi:glycosyltransferase involved in cell wall biosynthesis